MIQRITIRPTRLLDEWNEIVLAARRTRAEAGYWLAEEQPQKLVEILLDFFAEN